MSRCWIGTMLCALCCCSAAACSGADHDTRRALHHPRAERDAEVVDAAVVDAEAIDAAEPTATEPDAATAPEPEHREKPPEASEHHDAGPRDPRPAEPTHEVPQVSVDAGVPPAQPDDDDAGMPAADGGGVFDAGTTLPAHEFFSTV